MDIVKSYLFAQKEKERNFQQENSIPVEQVAQQFQPFNNYGLGNKVSCPASYPVYNMPSISRDKNYVNYMNQLYNNNKPIPNVYQGSTSGFQQQFTAPPISSINPYNMYQINGNQNNQQISNGPQQISNQQINKPSHHQISMMNQQLHNQQQIANISAQNQRRSVESFRNNNQQNNGQNIRESFENSNPNSNNNSNSNTSTYLTNLQDRPIVDFTHNNMVPFYGGKQTQSMAGTGVAQGNTIDGVSVDSGFDQSTPYQTKLSSFTGLDDNYLSKKEAGPMFSPAEQQQNWVFKTPVLREEMSQFTQSLSKSRNDLKPIQAEQVGPGLNLDPKIAAVGGYHDFTRILPNNVSDYKANQLENRINEGKYFSTGLPTSSPGPGGSLNKGPVGVVKNLPPKFFSQARYPTMSNKIGIVADYEMSRPDYEVTKKPKNAARDQTSYGYGNLLNVNGTANNANGVSSLRSLNNGLAMQTSVNRGLALVDSSGGPCITYEMPIGISPATTRGSLTSTRDPIFMSQDNNIRSVSDCNSIPLGNPSLPTAGSGPILTNYYVNQTDRGSINPSTILQTGLNGQKVYEKVNFLDEQRTTNKDTLIRANVGSAPNLPSAGSNFYRYDDVFRTTTRDTTNRNNTGSGPSIQSAGTNWWRYNDNPNTTKKETTVRANTGVGPSRGSDGTKFWTADDIARSTIKQASNFSYFGIEKNVGSDAPMNRTQFTGSEETEDINDVENFSNIETQPTTKPKPQPTPTPKKKKLKGGPRNGGADTYTIKGATLITNYVPGAGRSNIRQDPEQIQGKINFGNKCDQNYRGPSTLADSLPSVQYMQNYQFLAVPHAPVNKLFGLDDRQVASYQVEQLIKNPLSTYTADPNVSIPNLFAENKPDNYSELINIREQDEEAFADISVNGQVKMNSSEPHQGVNVYPKDGNVALNDNGTGSSDDHENSNIRVIENLSENMNDNPLLFTGSSRTSNNNPLYSGHAYSETFSKNGLNPKNTITLGGLPNFPTVYDENKFKPLNLYDRSIENGAINGSVVCKPSSQLYDGGQLMINRDLW